MTEARRLHNLVTSRHRRSEKLCRSLYSMVASAHVLMAMTGSAYAGHTAEDYENLSQKCLSTVLEVGGYRSFEGALFKSIRDGRLHLTENEADIFIKLSSRDNPGQEDTCGFEVKNVGEQEFGFFAAAMLKRAESLGLSRIRPFTETNFTFGACVEDKVKGPTDLGIRVRYFRKSKAVYFRAASSPGGYSECGE
ncbi:MAG: hypothetical protein AB3N22_03870 [Ruegeria sp.]